MCGKILLIYDCDPDKITPSHRFANTVFATQRWLYQIAVQHGKVAEIWYNQDIAYKDQDNCLFRNLEWIREKVDRGDVAWGGDQDPRAKKEVWVLSVSNGQG